MAKLHLGLGLVAAGFIAWACSTADEGTGTLIGSGGNTVALGSGGSQQLPSGTGSDTSLTVTDGDGGVLTFRRPQVCDAAGVCKCTTFASLGAAASKAYGNQSLGVAEGSDAFQAWLKDKSNLLSVDFFPTKPQALTAEWLAAYDVILIQDMRGWTFTPDELTAFTNWVNGGGGVIALSGYYSTDSAEIVPTNQLLAFSGIGLDATEVPGQDCNVAITEGNTVCPNTASQAKCYCWGNALPLIEWDITHPISYQVKSVGSFRGRVVVKGDGQTVVSFKGTPVGVTKTVGAGKVFIFGDEWVTYNSQWGAFGSPTTDPYNPCWDSSASASCLANHVFQTMQFWYNSITYVAPLSQCNFVIDEPDIILY